MDRDITKTWRQREQTGQLYGSKMLLANPARALKTVNQTELVPGAIQPINDGDATE